MSQNLGKLASTVGPSSQSASKESHTIEANRELQQILAANIEVPQTLMYAFNMFSSVASQCGTAVLPGTETPGALLAHGNALSFVAASSQRSMSSVGQSAHDLCISATSLSGAAQPTRLQAFMDQGCKHSSTNSLKPTEWFSAEAVMVKECEDTAWKYQGVRVDYDEQPRTHIAPNSGSPKRSHSETVTSSAVMNITCVDSTGPASITL